MLWTLEEISVMPRVSEACGPMELECREHAPLVFLLPDGRFLQLRYNRNEPELGLERWPSA